VNDSIESCAKEALRLRSFDLQSKSIEDLWALHEEVKGILVAKIEAQKLKLEKRIEQLQGNAKRPYPKVTPKFQNPELPDQTWSGRGQQPHWIHKFLAEGKSVDDFLIRK
jgi:DNA-binding protein H-NS